jgi:phosphoglycerate kinase
MPDAPCRPNSTRWQGAGAPTKPVIAIVGGAKVSPRSTCWKTWSQGRRAGDRRRHGQHLPACPGRGIGKSLAEKDLAATALRIIDKADAANCAIILPVDAVVAYHLPANSPSHAYGSMRSRPTA